MKIDAHQHFWSYNDTDYVWMGPGMERLRRDHTPEHLRPHLDAVGIDGTVAVQARQMERETDYLLDLASRFPWILGVVGWVDFAEDKLDTLQQRLETFAANNKLKGVRELIHDMPDTDYAVRQTHVTAVGMLSRYGLTYDLLLRPEHLAPATRLVDMYPDQPFVIDHIAKPPIASGGSGAWEEGLREIAKRPNVSCKLSGMVTEARWDAWSSQDLHPYIDVCVEAFGAERLMMGSDWPVCTLAGSYEEVMAVVMDYLSRLSKDERKAIQGATCARFYGLRQKDQKSG